MFDTQNTAQNVLLGSGSQSFGGSVANLDGLDYYKLQVNNRSNVSMSRCECDWYSIGVN